MASIFKKLNGVINNIFSIGLKDNKTTFTSTAESLSIDKIVDVGANAVKSSSTPTDVRDLVNLQYVNSISNKIYNSLLRVKYVICDSSLVRFQLPILFGNINSIYIKQLVIYSKGGSAAGTTFEILTDNDSYATTVFESSKYNIDLSVVNQYIVPIHLTLDGSCYKNFAIVCNDNSIANNMDICIEYAPMYNIEEDQYNTTLLKNSEEFSY